MSNYRRGYLPGYGIAHLLLPGTSPTDGVAALCGKRPGEYWFGESTTREQRYLSTLPTCAPCLMVANGKRPPLRHSSRRT